MSEHLLALGMFVFAIDRLSFDELDRRAQWRHGINDRFGARPAGQYLGPGEETISLTGTLVPEIAGKYSDIERLREMAGAGECYDVMLGDGTALGNFRILSVDDRWSNLVAGGRPRKVEFTVELQRADDEDGREESLP